MLKKLFGYFKREMKLTKEYYQSQEPPNTTQATADQIETKYQGNLSFADKERILVQRISPEDMAQFDKMPYRLDFPIHKLIEEHAHPFAYMNLIGHNVAAAKNSLEEMNARIHSDSYSSSVIPRLSIPIEDIVFTPSSEHGYTKLICTPYTFEGEISQFPLTLSFMTDLTERIDTPLKDTTHGSIYYNKEGNIAKADIYFWRRNEGFFFYYETLNQSFLLSKVEYTDVSVPYRPPTQIYKDEYWVKLESMRKKELEDFEWVKENIPAKCPKSISGYRRMKHSNSKNFQALAIAAKGLGRDIT